MKLDLKILNKYVEDGWLIKQSHPTLPLDIYNYSRSTQFENHWDEITLMCRGLVVHQESGKIIARPFPKFFNIEEGKHIASNNFSIYDKMDGSLIIAFYYHGWQVASRGSFTSDQAIMATKLFNNLNCNEFSIHVTYLFELIGPSNRIVVKYPEDKLILLSAFKENDNDYWEASRDILYTYSQLANCDLVKAYDFKDYNEIQQLNWENHEGFVVLFDNGSRCKIKFEDYKVLHGIITNMSSYTVWEYLMKFGKIPEEMLTEVPDEFYDWIHNLSNKLLENFYKIKNESYKKFESMRDYYDNRKEFAKYAVEYKHSSLLFLHLDIYEFNKIKENEFSLINFFENAKSKHKEVGDYTPLEYVNHRIEIQKNKIKEFIWKGLKPEYERPFNIKIDEEEI